MNRLIYSIIVLFCFPLIQSCGVIAGGSKYIAHVKVKSHPAAEIHFDNALRGTGDAVFKIKRSRANNITFTVTEEGCKEQQFAFNDRTFRGWALVGTIVTWTGLVPGTAIPLPWGVAVDVATGSLWKPSVHENGVSKIDYKNYQYLLDYKCKKGDNE